MPSTEQYYEGVLIPPHVLREQFGVSPSGVLHVGAHMAEEQSAYREENFGRIIWVEAQPLLVAALRKQAAASGDLVLEGAVWGSSGVSKILHITNNGQSSSLYELAEHSHEYPSIVRVDEIEVSTVRLDRLLSSSEKFDFLNLDVQGAELEALMGLGGMLSQVKWVYSEVNRSELYSGIPLVAELDNFLKQEGFVRVCTAWTTAGWGDALYCRRSFSPKFLLFRIRGLQFNSRAVIRSWLKKGRTNLADPAYRWLLNIGRIVGKN
jgi:FkbM family methyltransferase